MLKKKIFKKIGILLLCLLIIGIIRIYPKDKMVTNLSTHLNTGVIYLLDSNDYVARLDLVYKNTKKEDVIKEMIHYLTKDKENNFIRDGFYPIIPENTKLLDMQITNDLVTLNFSKELLNIEEKYEEKLIEALVYTITSLEDINFITIKVSNNILTSLPYSKRKLPKILDRSIKINKIYDINSIKDIKETTVYYPAIYEGYPYFIPVTKIDNSKNEKIEIIINELKSSNTYNSNLVNYLNSETKLMSYELVDKSIILNFNDSLFSDINSKHIDEEITYAINMSIKENYNDVKTVFYYVNDNLITNYFLFLG